MCIICLIHSQTIDLRVYEGLQQLLKKGTHLNVHRNILRLTVLITLQVDLELDLDKNAGAKWFSLELALNMIKI